MSAPELQPLTAVEQAAIEEEEGVLRRVLARLLELRSTRQLRGDATLRIQELREDAASAREEDLPAILDQLHGVWAVEDRGRTQVSLPEPRSPYFAHFRLREGERVRDYLLGHASFLDSATGLRVLDWRNAPLSQLYYRYREGDSYEIDLPRGRAEGRVELRRAVVIVGGELRAIESPLGRLERTAAGWTRRGEEDLPTLAGGSGTAERGLGVGVGRAGRVRVDVSALLDPVQFELINRSGDGPLLVLGSAGSGKTTVALHRLAALHHQEPQRFGQQRLSVVVPERGLSRLVTRLLEPLGLGQVEVRTFTELAQAELTRVAPGLPRTVRDDAPPLVAQLKRHRALRELLPSRIGELSRSRHGIETLRRELLTDRGFLRRVVERAGGQVRESAVEDTVRRTMRQMDQRAEAAYRGVDADRLATLDGRRLDADTPEDLAQTLDAEDLPILLELFRLSGVGQPLRRRAHLVIDEAQDLCALELSALRQTLGAEPSVTVAGDDVQRTGEGDFDGWDAALETLGAADAPRHTLAVSYRCPLPIAILAHRVLGSLAPGPAPISGRSGAPVRVQRYPHFGAQVLSVQDAVADLVSREPQASVGVLARNLASAMRWAQALQHIPEARFVNRGDFSFDPGVDICEVAEAKGLEFDYVVLPDVDAASYPPEDESRRVLHVAVTRAMHQLWIGNVGTPSPLLLPSPEASKLAGQESDPPDRQAAEAGR